MQGPIRWVLVTGLLIGCDLGGVPDPNTPGVDAPVGPGGLVVEWSTDPAGWPGTIGPGIVLERARFAIDSVRVIGDAGPGDPRTTQTAFELRWNESNQPEPIMFSNAPSGLYSQVSVLADGHTTTETFELRGRVTIGSDTWPFDIESNAPLEVTVSMAHMLTPPAVTTVKLQINFTAALQSLDWAAMDIDDGEREMTDSDTSEMSAFRTLLVSSFDVVDSGGGTGAGVQ